jgi:glycosyltransferase involved in cell wall biosynthesis
MTIAINSNQFIKCAGNDFFYDDLVQLATSKPAHQFIFITPAAMDGAPGTYKNITCVISYPMANHPLMWKVWLDYTLPGIARKHRADILINTGGACSLRTKIPQWLFISDLSFLNYPRFFSGKQLYFLKKFLPAFLVKANSIVTASNFLTSEILQQYSMNEEKINAFQLIPGDHFQVTGWKEKEAIKDKYAEGKEYFLFSGEMHPRNNLVNLLKAFSFFKKRQKSNMQLIISVKASSQKDPFIANIKTYKYRKEVTLLTDLPEKDLAKITAAAYAFIYPVLYEGTAIFPLQAMLCEVPVITSVTGALNKIAGEAVLYVDPENYEDIAEKMMLLFKDENKRTELINRAKLIASKNNKDKRDELFWESILKPIG